MGLLSTIEDKAREWLFSKAAKKAAITLGQGAAAYLAAKHGVLDHFGLSFSGDPATVAGGLLWASEIARNWLKFKYPGVCGWM